MRCPRTLASYFGLGVEPTGAFLHQIRRATTRAEFFTLCRQFLDHDEPMPLEPFAMASNPTDVNGRRDALSPVTSCR